jgi:hypothetical protein
MKSNKQKIEEDKYSKQLNDNKTGNLTSTINPTQKPNKFKVTNEKANNNQSQQYNHSKDTERATNQQLVYI